MRKYASTAIGISLAMLCGACAIRVMPSSVEVGGIVQMRPQSHISLSEVSDGRWRKIEISIVKKKVLSLRQWESTFHVEISDCASKSLRVEDFYINDVSTAQLSSMDNADFDAFYARSSDPVLGTIYLQEAIYSNEKHICGQLVGGSMIAAKVLSDQFRIK